MSAKVDYLPQVKLTGSLKSWVDQEVANGKTKAEIVREALRKQMEEEETRKLKRELTIKAILGQE